MIESWGIWTNCKNKPDLNELELRKTEIHYLGYEVVVIEYYDKRRWDPSGTEIRVIKQYDQKEWEKLKNEKKIMLP